MQKSLTRWLLAAVLALVSSATASTANYQGLWFNPAESGWGINFAHQGDVIFASWFTYDLTGNGTWLVMTANKSAPNTYTGQLFQGTGPAFDSVPFPPLGSPGGATVSGLGGTGTLTFTDANNATFAYTVAGISQTKTITRQLFGPQPTCTFGAQPNLAVATNYTDLWWGAPAGSEAGWGVNLTHQGDIIFATWFTFDHDRTPRWMVVQATKTGPGVYTGTQVFRLTGPAFNAVPFPAIGSAGGPTGVIVGTASFSFSDGNNAMFSYTVDGVIQSKAITREVFVSPGTVCETPSTSTTTAEGGWLGTTADGRMVRAIILDDGTYYVVYSFPGVRPPARRGARIEHAQSMETLRRPTAADFPIAARRRDRRIGNVRRGQWHLRASHRRYSCRFSRAPHRAASRRPMIPASDHPADLATAAGSYTGESGSMSQAQSRATFTLDANGHLAGRNCRLYASVAPITPRKSVNVFDWTVTGANCIFGSGGASGVMYYDEVNRELNGFAPFAARTDQFYLLGAKP